MSKITVPTAPTADPDGPPIPTAQTLAKTLMFSEHDVRMLQYQLERLSAARMRAHTGLTTKDYGKVGLAVYTIEDAIGRMAEVMMDVRPGGGR